MSIRPLIALAFLSFLLWTVPGVSAVEAKKGLAITEGTTASIEYTLSDEKGVQIETSKGSEPIAYTHGESNVVPGLKKALTGLHAGDERDVRVSPEDGFGKIDPKAFQEVPKDKIPAEALQVGAVLKAHSPEGMTIPVRVSEIKENTAVVDFNHPLAGKTLVFHVKVLDVKEKTAPEPAAAVPPAPQPGS